MINTNNLQTIKQLADKIEYTVTNTVKEARISYNAEASFNTAWDMYKDDMMYLYSEIKKDVIAIYNHNTRDYSNMFTVRNKQVSNAIDWERIKGLTKKERDLIDEIYFDVDNCLVLELSKQVTDKTYLLLKLKVEKNFITETVTATGYSQSDWDKYTIVTYKDIDTSETSSYSNLLANIKHMFTVQEYYIQLVDIETRLYTSGIEDIEEVEQDAYGTVTYTGTLDKDEIKDLEKQGYTIIHKD